MTLNQNSHLVFIILIYIGDIKFLFLWGVGGGGYDLQFVLNVIFIFSPEITV